MKKLIKGKPYLFEWNDTYSFNGWHTEEDIDKLTLRRHLETSVGIFIREDPMWYIIAAHKNSNENYKPWGDINWIPKNNVLKIKKL